MQFPFFLISCLLHISGINDIEAQNKFIGERRKGDFLSFPPCFTEFILIRNNIYGKKYQKVNGYNDICQENTRPISTIFRAIKGLSFSFKLSHINNFQQEYRDESVNFDRYSKTMNADSNIFNHLIYIIRKRLAAAMGTCRKYERS